MNLVGKIGLGIVVMLVLIATVGPFFIAPEQVTFQDLDRSFDPPSWAHPMGLDENGRDILARVVYGARVSLTVGVIVVAISSLVGMLLGLVSGYVGGWVDRFISGF
ncbi:MAG: ABC transporter permease, partial [Chloracidobacterium sp.]